ncbi:MAG: type II toxin-antitoxin system RelE/ParE family toxin [Deltaproteobacteria bacterium]|nr:type II toxin-antitoxin system RelE/ParE family toxin [Deltaproteobacteria bacterium]
MIKTFKCKETEKIFYRRFSKKLPESIQRQALRKLRLINAADNLDALAAPPTNQLEKLKHDRAGRFSVRINDQWRICFEWRDNNAYEVEIVDYH